MRSRIPSDEFRVSFFDTKISAFEGLAGLLGHRYLNCPRPDVGEKLFNVVERAKGRAILDALTESEAENEIDPHLKQKENELTRNVSEILAMMKELDADRREFKALAERLGHAEDELSRFNSRRDNGRSAGKFDEIVGPFTLRDVQQRLLDDESGLMEYFLGEKASWLLLVTRTGQSVFKLPPRKQIEASVKAYTKIISSPPRGAFQGGAAARRLFRELAFPLELDCAQRLKRLIVIPDGPLCCLPFEALAVDDGRIGLSEAFLISRFQISYAASASSLIYLKERRGIRDLPSGKALFAVGNPACDAAAEKTRKRLSGYQGALRDYFLDQGFAFSRLPHAEREVREIAALFRPDRRTILINEAGTETAVKSVHLRDYQILHFACHGFVDEEEPMRSALILALDHETSEDGFLQAREIGALDLDADMVVLSACRTAHGSLKRGEGVLDLARCFIRAGARTVVASLWGIDDRATSVLMKDFYGALIQGSAKGQALRSAKLRMIRSGEDHPFYWAGFILNGDGQSGLAGEN
jgi:CHAT domain-containing protein